MPSVERDAPDPRYLRHSHSSSIGALIPMWDSADPERAPPPLPLNPQSPSVGPSRAGTSLAIQSAHAALTEKARETALVPTLTKRATTDISPERALVQRPSPHKRMQSMQPGSVRDLSLFLEGSRDSANSTPRASPEKERYTRPSTPSRAWDHDRDRDAKSTEKENTAPGTPTPLSSSLGSSVRPSMRRPQHSILGENTPPQSATMLALNNMPASSVPRGPEAPLANVTNNSTALNSSALVRSPAAQDQLSEQLLTLTNICAAVQKEMSQLSRRSRDNATDLMSLKEATHARDEDIRKSLRELALGVDGPRHHRDTYTGGLYLDNKAFNSSTISKTSASRPFSLPRIPSPTSFAASIDRESSLSTPSLIGGDSPATLALLEKIIRDMGTKDGQELVMGRLSELADRLSGMASAVKVEELIGHLNAAREQHAMVSAADGGSNRPRNFSFDDDDEPRMREVDYSRRNGAILLHDQDSRLSSASPFQANALVTEDIMKIIRSVKDSVSQGGGMTAEVKALVRELRGEVLGMGREIGRKLDESNVMKGHSKSETKSREDVATIVEEGLEQMKVYMYQRLRDARRESTESTKSAVDYQDVYNAVKAALTDAEANKSEEPQISRDDVLLAIKEAWENYKPDIQVEQLGLERDEVLACLKEGLQEYAPPQDAPQGATREEVFVAVVEGLKHFTPPKVDTPATLSRDEILEAVRECLEEFEFPLAPSAMGNDLTRDDMLDAVKEGLNTFEFPSQDAPLVPTRDDMLDAVREGLNTFEFPSNDAALIPSGGDNSELVERLHDIMQYMQDEFKAVSEEAKQNVAANGRDTEQVLDATKDGFETLRVHMEGYVERVSGASGQEEVMANIINSLDNFRDEVSELVAKAADGSKDVLKEEIETLRETMNSSLVPHVPPAVDHKEALEAIRDGLERVRSELLRPHAGITDILDALHDGFIEVQHSIERMNNKPVDLTANDEILDALKSGLDGVRTDIDSLRETNQNDRAVAAVTETPTDALIPTDLVKQDDIRNLEVMMTQLRIKMEAMEAAQPAPAPEGNLSKDDLVEMEEMLRKGVSKDDLNDMEEMLRKGVSKDDLNGMEELLRYMQQTMAAMSASKDPEAPIDPDAAATKEDIIAIETILRNTKGRLDDLMDGEQAVRKDHVDAVEALVLETKDSLGSLAGQLETMTRKDDLLAIESLVTQATLALDEMKERAEKSLEDPEKVTKTDVDALEALVLDVKTVVEQMVKSDIAALPSKEDIKNLEDLVKEIKDYNTAQTESNSQALELRNAENATVSERVAEVKTFLEEFQDMVKERLEAGGTNVETLGTLLTSVSETIGNNATVGDDLKEMLETMKVEFEESRAGVVGAKLDTDEKFKETTDSLGAKIDEKIGELITKYDEFALVMDDRTKAEEEKDLAREAAMGDTKAVAEELKVLVDTLGSSVTDSLEKMEEASKTVFEKVEVLYSKAEDNHSDDRNEHQVTRDQVKDAITKVEGLQGHVSEYQPQILESVKDVLLIVGQHYEHSKSSASELQQRIEDSKPPEKEEPPLLPPPEPYDDTEVHAKLDKIDSEVHTKLDKLVDHTHAAGKAYSQLDTLDKVHQQVVQTAADISEFLSSQKQRVEDDHEDREKTLQETTIALERQKAEQEHVEANVAYLRDEEAQLRESVLALRTEQEFLARQKTRLTADLSSLETALHLRREELHAMDTRAEGLERRILEGVLDHSRALLMTKSSAKGRDAMSRKRVPGARTSLGPVEAPNAVVRQTSKPRSAVNLAVNGNRASLIPPNPAGASRRILSLSQITNNMPTGGLKRSQSVRTAAALRKSSWAPGRVGAGKGYGDLDKENVDLVRESDEEVRDTPEPEAETPTPMEHDDVPTPGDETPTQLETPTPLDEGDNATELTAGGTDDLEKEEEEEEEYAAEESDAGTLRRSSLGTTVITSTETEGGYTDYTGADEDDDAQSEWTESHFGPASSGSGSGSRGDDHSMISESLADTDSIAGEGEVVVYAA
ncbi:Uu.00g066660.m01.CDS01 [Anthostomella pinea]|uniref:Uu.00g066660.m01.CDS01 n=1 Tax=Anthostomella pinea TaxID=933095 RepID=A0AAI8VU03_9PEZI|nr:Uu.00g066660.m01.CDS01 [Anthostomella pinea]